MQIASVYTTDDPYLARLFDFWQKSRVNLVPYSFTAEWNTLGALGVGVQPTTNMTIDPSIDFILKAMNFSAHTTSDLVAPVASPNVLLSLTEKSGANIFSDVEHHISLWGGSTANGKRAYFLPFPRLIKGNNQIVARLTDLSNVAMRCFLGFEGVRVTYVNVDRTEVFPFLSF